MSKRPQLSRSAAANPEQPSGRLIGYARVSTAEQSLQMQIDYLVKAGVDPSDIYAETVSGVSSRRRALDGALARARRGDTLVVWKLDRIGRSMLDLLKRMQDMDNRGIGLRSVTDRIDTTTPIGRLVLHVMAAIAQFERDLTRERTKAGVRSYMARGGKMGQPRKLAPEQEKEAWKMLQSGMTRREVGQHFGVHQQTIFNRVVKPRQRNRKPQD